MTNLYYNFLYRSVSNDILISTVDNSFVITVSPSTQMVLHDTVLIIPISPTTSLKLNYYEFNSINGTSIETLALTDLLSIENYLSINCFKGASNSSSSSATELTQSANGVKLDNILTELKDDKFLAETIWYDKTDVTKFYVRDLSLNQDTGAITIVFNNIDGTLASPIISNLVQTVTNVDIEIISTLYEVGTSGTGYSIGDTVEELKLVNTNTNVITYIYYNKSTNGTISPVYSSLQLQGKYVSPSHIELLSSVTASLPANTYKSISLAVMDGSCNITIDGVTINNFPTNYSEVWGNGISIINKIISVTTNSTSRVIINLIK